MIKLLKKLFHRESTFEEVAIEAKELFWQKQNKRVEVRRKWEERKQRKIQKMKEASYLGFYRKPVTQYNCLPWELAAQAQRPGQGIYYRAEEFPAFCGAGSSITHHLVFG